MPPRTNEYVCVVHLWQSQQTGTTSDSSFSFPWYIVHHLFVHENFLSWPWHTIARHVVGYLHVQRTSLFCGLFIFVYYSGVKRLLASNPAQPWHGTATALSRLELRCNNPYSAWLFSAVMLTLNCATGFFIFLLRINSVVYTA